MPMPDGMGVVFTGTQKQDIIDGLNGVLGILNGIKVVALTKTERSGANSIEEIRFPYAIKAIQLAPLYPDLQPGFLSLTGAINNVAMMQDMNQIQLTVNEVNARFTDFALAVEHYAYEYLRKLYAIAKEALGTNTPGAQEIVDALAPLFENQGGSNQTLPPTT